MALEFITMTMPSSVTFMVPFFYIYPTQSSIANTGIHKRPHTITAFILSQIDFEAISSGNNSV